MSLEKLSELFMKIVSDIYVSMDKEVSLHFGSHSVPSPDPDFGLGLRFRTGFASAEV